MFTRSTPHVDGYARRVGQRSNTETIIAVLKAFLDQRTWKQADLARHVGVQPATIHKRLEELAANGVPLTSEKEHPHVYWSVPKSWYPGGVLFTGEQVTEVFRQLSRMPRSRARNLLIESLLRYLPAREAAAAIVPAETTAREEQYLPIVEDAANQRVALRFNYFTATRGDEGTRHASVHRVVFGPPARFVATCHRTGLLKWFRVENVSDARLDPREAVRPADDKLVDAHLRASLDGFHEGAPPEKHEFFVSDPDARWVARNLMEAMHADQVPGGIRVTIETSALTRLARFVVGLGSAAKPLSPALEAAVEALAKGALDAIASR
jgi:predicted DNA-binding transcriptional regulator YafY